MHWRRKWQPTPVFLPGESQGRGAWSGTVYGVAQSRTRRKWCSCSSSSSYTEEQHSCSVATFLLYNILVEIQIDIGLAVKMRQGQGIWGPWALGGVAEVASCLLKSPTVLESYYWKRASSQGLKSPSSQPPTWGLISTVSWLWKSK